MEPTWKVDFREGPCCLFFCLWETVVDYSNLWAIHYVNACVCFIFLLCVCLVILVPVFLFLMAVFFGKDAWHLGVLEHYLTTSGPTQQMKTWKLRTLRPWLWFLVTSPKQWKFLLKRWHVWEGGGFTFPPIQKSLGIIGLPGCPCPRQIWRISPSIVALFGLAGHLEDMIAIAGA